MEWIRVSRSVRCPVCGKPDWCSVTDCGTKAHCMRVESAKDAKGGGWIHRLEGQPVQLPLAVPKRSAAQVDWPKEVERMYRAERAGVLRARLADRLGVSIDATERMGIGRGCDRHGEYAAIPVRQPDGTITGVMRRYEDGKKLTAKGSKAGLFYEPNWLRRSGPVLLVEGASDVLACMTAGVSAIGRWSCVGSIDELATMLGDCKRVLIVVGENDRKEGKCEACEGCQQCWPGRYGAKQTAARLSKRLRRKVRWLMSPDESKDVRDWLRKNEMNGGLLVHRLWRKELAI